MLQLSTSLETFDVNINEDSINASRRSGRFRGFSSSGRSSGTLSCPNGRSHKWWCLWLCWSCK